MALEASFAVEAIVFYTVEMSPSEASSELPIEPKTIHGFSLTAKQQKMRDELEKFQTQLCHRPTEGFPVQIGWILRYIHEHLFEDDLSVGKIRREGDIRNHNVSSRFRKYIGVTMKHYIETRRLEAALLLLRHTQIELFLIAMAVGYRHPETFSRAFRRRFDASPSEYRNKLKQIQGCTAVEQFLKSKRQVLFQGHLEEDSSE